MGVLLAFVAGLLFANGIPHFTNGISGRRFHSPFAKPFVRGLSSPLSNVLWGMSNFLVAGLLMAWSGGSLTAIDWRAAALGGGFIVSAVGLSVFFGSLSYGTDVDS